MRRGLVFDPLPAGAEGVFAALDQRLRRDCVVPIAVALSGGGDSLALLRLAEIWARGAGRPLLALTVDHGLSPDSAAWTAFAASRAAESGVTFRALAWRGDKPKTGLPAAARSARHALLASAVRDAGGSVVLVGHTRDDVTETDLMRATDAPGIGRLRPWSPSPAWPQGRGVMLLRPLLAVKRVALRDWLTGRGETWIDDPANEDSRFARVRARAAVQSDAEPSAPCEPPIERDIAGLAQRFEDAPEGAFSVPLAALQGAPPVAISHVLSAAVLCVGGGSTPPRRAEVERLSARLLAGSPGAATLRGARIERLGGDILFTREAGDALRNPRPEADDVIDGRRLASGAGWLGLERFRAATFQIDRETNPAPPQNHFLAFSQTSGTSVVTTINPHAQA